MPINLKFHIGNLIIGFVISIWWFFEEKKKVGPPIGTLSILASWIFLNAFLFSSQNMNLSFLEALPKTLDVNQFRFGYGQMKGVVGTSPVNAATFFMLVMISTNTLFFRWVWLMKNKKEANRSWESESYNKQKKRKKRKKLNKESNS